MSELEDRVKGLEEEVQRLRARTAALEESERLRTQEKKAKEWPAMGRSYEPI